MTQPLIRLRHLLPASGEKGARTECAPRPFSPPRGEKVPKADEGWRRVTISCSDRHIRLTGPPLTVIDDAGNKRGPNRTERRRAHADRSAGAPAPQRGRGALLRGGPCAGHLHRALRGRRSGLRRAKRNLQTAATRRRGADRRTELGRLATAA